MDRAGPLDRALVTLSVVVSDGHHDVRASTTIARNAPPSGGVAGAPRVAAGSHTRLHATVTDPEGDPLSYAWSTDCGAIEQAGGESAIFVAPDRTCTANVQVLVRDACHSTQLDLAIAVLPRR